MQLQIKKLDPEAQLPTRAHDTDAGFDLYAVANTTISVGGNVLIPTGIAVKLPAGTVGLIHPRSGLAAKHRVTVLNAPGTVDQGYVGQILVNLINHGSQPYTVRHHDRIAQLVIQEYLAPEIVEVDELEATDRSDRGHGSTGS